MPSIMSGQVTGTVYIGLSMLGVYITATWLPCHSGQPLCISAPCQTVSNHQCQYIVCQYQHTNLPTCQSSQVSALDFSPHIHLHFISSQLGGSPYSSRSRTFSALHPSCILLQPAPSPAVSVSPVFVSSVCLQCPSPSRLQSSQSSPYSCNPIVAPGYRKGKSCREPVYVIHVIGSVVLSREENERIKQLGGSTLNRMDFAGASFCGTT